MTAAKMRRIGLTGPIAAGKSVVAARLRELGLTVIDYDQLSHQVVEPGGSGWIALRQRFGDQLIGPDQAIDRAGLGRLVFADPKARADLEAIVHPLVAARAEALEEAARSGGAAAVVHDIPLLVETGQPDRFDLVLVVQAPLAIRLDRLVRERGLTPEQARRRIAAQADDAARQAVADQLFDGAGSVAGLRDQVTAWFERWRARAS
ncbi:MAG: dephospho-CoA kinase [Propionibacteriaceae bacterium]|jgi:dephospho-CoA kinase|nr:dephospho-CoA kinase [Propionibacteriaceae bacterium]